MVRMTKMKKLWLAGVMVASSLMGSDSWGVLTPEETTQAHSFLTGALKNQNKRISEETVRLEAFLNALLGTKEEYATPISPNASAATKGIHAFATNETRKFKDASFVKTLLQATESGIFEIVPEPWFKGTTKRSKVAVFGQLDDLFQKQETLKSNNKEKIFPKDLTLLGVLLQENLSLAENKFVFKGDAGSPVTQAPHFTQWATEMGIIGNNLSDDRPFQERLLSLCTQRYFNPLSSKEEFAKPEHLVALVAYGDALTSWLTRPTLNTEVQEETVSQAPDHLNFKKIFNTFVWSQLYPQKPTDAVPDKVRWDKNFVSLSKLTLSHTSPFLTTYTPQAFHQWVGERIFQNNHAVLKQTDRPEQTLLWSVIKDHKNSDGTPCNHTQLIELYKEKLYLCTVLASHKKS